MAAWINESGTVGLATHQVPDRDPLCGVERGGGFSTGGSEMGWPGTCLGGVDTFFGGLG